MKKMIVALLLIVPLLFLLTVFSITEAGSLNVQIPVSGIEIKNKLEDKTLYVDLADYANDYKIEVAVYPANAANKKYSFEVEKLEGSDFAEAEVSDDGVLTVRSTGLARVVVKSYDGGYSDSITVVAGSSKVLYVVPSLYAQSDSGQSENLICKEENGYFADVQTGIYSYAVAATPSLGTQVSAECVKGFAVIDESSRGVILPFGGECELEFAAEDGKGGIVRSRAVLNVQKTANTSGILVNGNDLYTVAVDSYSRKGECYVACPTEPSLTGADAVFLESVLITQVQSGGYKIEFATAEGAPSQLQVNVSSAGKLQRFNISIGEYSFSLRTDLPVQTGEKIAVITGAKVKFYAVSSAITDDVEYVWTAEGSPSVVIRSYGAMCEVDGGLAGEKFELSCEAFRNGKSVMKKSIAAEVVNLVSVVSFGDRQGAGLAAQTAIAEFEYKDGKIENNSYSFALKPYSAGGGDAGVYDFDYTLSDENIASVFVNDGKVFLKILSSGEVTLTATWKGAQSYGSNVAAKYTFVAVKNGVGVSDSDGFFAATSAGNPVVVNSDIVLGTDGSGNAYSLEKLESMLGTMNSTYNTEFLKNSGMQSTVRYVAEFKNDVYGNGYSVSAEKFTLASDATGTPLLFKGSLPLVGVYADKSLAMKVSAQDNIAFLLRTDGVTLSNLNLLGCSDSLITTDNGTDLAKLNNAGTVLDINADCRIVNCRIKNGKTCVRVFGGNVAGDSFMCEYIDGSDISDKDRITVEIDGCIISQAREFLIKTGTNRAVKSSALNGDEPDLFRADAGKYSPFENNAEDKYFYDKYVMTDLTLRNSVLEKSGLFALGLETNFSGSVLNGDKISGFDFAKNWGVGGTSYASVVRLEGDVRFYDWKQVDNIDSSQLVEVFSGGIFDGFVLDIRKMLETVVESAQAEGNHAYDGLFDSDENGVKYVNSAIVKYGGGKNYSVLDVSELDEKYRDFSNYKINISVLRNSSDPNIKMQGEYLPLAAGTQDFVFTLYSSDSANSLAAQLEAYADGTAYNGVKAVRRF